MKIILLEDVASVGRRFEVKEVKPGFARNLLFQKNLAILATKENIRRQESAAERHRKEKALNEELLVKGLESLKDTVLTVSLKANKEGHLFKGVSKKEIVKLLEEQKRLFFSEEVILLPKPIKTIGEHIVPIHINNKEGMVTLSISPLD